MHKEKIYYVYILTNKMNTVLYVGVTGDLTRRIYEHKEGLVEGFTKRYNVHKLIYFESFESPSNAIKREKQLKGWSRERKLSLIKNNNPELKDLYEEFLEQK